jgi:outer membrane protein assembly factor BamE (lipoprotein component of BamABCDE complex)
MILRSLVLFATASLLVGCANPGSSYAAKHPDLPPAHRQILQQGKIPSGDAVAGMTRAQVKLAMGGDPTTFDKVGNEDVWIYARKKAVGVESFDDLQRSGSSRMENTHSFTQTSDFGPRVDVEMKTSIYFQGDRATHALNTEEKP